MIIMMIILDRFGFGSRDQLVNIGHQFVIFSMLRAPLSMVSLNKFIAEIFMAWVFMQTPESHSQTTDISR